MHSRETPVAFARLACNRCYTCDMLSTKTRLLVLTLSHVLEHLAHTSAGFCGALVGI